MNHLHKSFSHQHTFIYKGKTEAHTDIHTSTWIIYISHLVIYTPSSTKERQRHIHTCTHIHRGTHTYTHKCAYMHSTIPLPWLHFPQADASVCRQGGANTEQFGFEHRYICSHTHTNTHAHAHTHVHAHAHTHVLCAAAVGGSWCRGQWALAPRPIHTTRTTHVLAARVVHAAASRRHRGACHVTAAVL